MDSTPLAALAVSLGLGLLVGLQRERSGSRLAGVRTFPLITMLGTLAALAGERAGGQAVVIAAGFVALAAATLGGNYLLARQGGDRDPGITTEVAILVMYAIGVYAGVGETTAALAVGVAVALLLQAKGRLHGWARTIGDKDMRAILLFAAITFVVLPIVPDETYGPYGVWNPRHIWLMVVLVVGISLGGYVAYKLSGARTGAVLGGFLGGLVSSTATTVTFARRARTNDAFTGTATLAIVAAACVVHARVIAEVAIVAPGLLDRGAGPFGVMFVVSLALVLAAWGRSPRDGAPLPEPENPTELRPALLFAGLYALVLLAVEWVRQHIGTQGVYAVAALSGLTDMDAITLSTARLAGSGEIDQGTAWRAIVIAAISNLAFKAGAVVALGGPRLGRLVGALFAVQVAVAVLLILLWP